MATLADVRAAQPLWFSRKNKRFFGDVGYRVLHSKKTGEPYLVRSTYAWTDMFGAPKRLHYRVNVLNDDLTVGRLIDDIFPDMWAVKRYLREN